MHITLGALFFLLAIIFLALATLGVPSPPRFSWLPAGLLCALLAQGSIIVG